MATTATDIQPSIQLSDIISLKSTQADLSSVSNSTSGSNKDSMTKESHCHQKATSPTCKRPRIVLKFSSESRNETDDNVASSKTLVPTNVEVSAKGKTRDEKDISDRHDTRLGLGLEFVPPPKDKAQKKKIIFSNKFPFSLARDQIEADLLAMSICGSNSTKRSNKRSKKRPLNVWRQQDHLFPDTRLKFIKSSDYRVHDSA